MSFDPPGSGETYQQWYYRTVTKPKQERLRAARQASEVHHPLKAARLARGLTIVETALAMGLNEYAKTIVSNWEHGRTIPAILYADKLAQVLGLESGAHVQQLCREWQAAQQEGKDNKDGTGTA